MRNMRWLLCLALVPFVAMLSGCGGGGGGSTSTTQANSVLPNSAVNSSSAPGASTVASGARNWQVTAGGQRRDQALQALDFFDETITIDEGDSVTWTDFSLEPHTVTFLGPRPSPPPPDDPTAALPFGGNTYDGTVYTSSGFIEGGQTYTLTFPKAGTYAYLCIIHQPVMTGTITVQRKGTPYPHPQGFYTGQGLQALNGVLAAAQGSIRQFPYTDGGTTLVAGIAPGLSSAAPTTSTVLRFLDSDTFNGKSTVTVPRGTTLTWNNQSNNEPHTVTFPPLGQQPPENPFSPPTGPLTGQTYDGSALVNSGVLLPGQAFSLTFTKPGTYTYFCLFHDGEGMIGTVVVT